MAATSTLRGRYVARTYKTWDEFTDQKSGEVVPAGHSLTIHVVDGDGELDSVKVPREHVSAVRERTNSLGFGVEVEIAVAVDRYGMKFKELLKPGAVASVPKAG